MINSFFLMKKLTYSRFSYDLHELHQMFQLLKWFFDLNLFFGNIKIKPNGTSGGHNGLKDIEDNLGTSNYSRLRVGISNNNKIPKSDYVLGKWSSYEMSNINTLTISSIEIIFSFIQTGIEETMNLYNKKNFIK